jgi:hypothetical protein
MSVSVSSLGGGGANSNKGFNTVYVGTEPTAFYRSDDGAESWDKMSSLNNVSSSSSWSYPPRPWTLMYAGLNPIKLSHDGGKRCIDKVQGGPYDTHTLATHKKVPGLLYSAARDGYFESYDYGQSWKRSNTAVLRHHGYLAGLAIDADDPRTIIVSASQWARQARFLEAAESVIYRRTSSEKNGNVDDISAEEWKLISNGLPKPTGTLISILTANPKIAGAVYAINNRGIFCSTDSGVSWKRINDDNAGIEWPKKYLAQHPRALAVREDT